MSETYETPDTSYKYEFHVFRFLIGLVVLGAVWLGLSYGVTLYAQGTADRVAGYINRPDYVTYTSKNSSFSFEYPSILIPDVINADSTNIEFKQQGIDGRVLNSNNSSLYMSLLSRKQIVGFETTQEQYYQQSKDKFYSDTALSQGVGECKTCSDSISNANGTDVLILRDDTRTTYVQYEVHVWTADWTYQINISGTVNETNAGYVEHILTSIKAGS